MLTRQGISGSHASAAAMSELIVNTATSAVVTAGALVYFLETLMLPPPLAALARLLVALSGGYVIVVIAAVVSRTYVVGALIRVARVVPAIARLVDPADVRRMEDAIHSVLRDRPSTLLRVWFLEVAAQAILVTEMYWTMRSMELSPSLNATVRVEVLTKLVNAVQFVGATEGAYAVIFDLLGMTAAVGFALSLVKRLRSIVVAIAGVALTSLYGNGGAALPQPRAIVS